MANEKILVVDDDVNICELLRLYLEKEGYTVSIVNDGESAVKSFGEIQPDLMLLDIMLPRLDGWQVCREIRKFSDKPIIMLTAKGETFDKVLGLELGADDYLAKPVQPRLLLARIKALLRRTPGTTGAAEENHEIGESSELSFGNFRISQATRSTHLGDDVIDLTTAEFDLLWLLARHAGNILSRDDLLQQLRGIGFDGLDRSIDARISRLRRKLGDDPENPTRIKTVRGKGYLFSKHDWQ